MSSVVESSDRLAGMDFAAHNAEVARAWEALNAWRPYRVVTICGTNTRYFMFNAGANPDGMTFEAYSNDPAVMFETQLRFARWSRFNLLQDQELGTPKEWSVWVDFQNYYEAAWFGCPVEFMDDQVPDTTAAFADCPERVMENGIPDPNGGLMAKLAEYSDYFIERCKTEAFLDKPLKFAHWGALGTDGPLTVACNLFGAGFVCETMLGEPERYHKLMDFITTATIARITAGKKRVGAPIPCDGFGIADDSVALISTEAYIDHVLPYHRRIYDAFGNGKGHGMHLCGDATRHFKTIRDELGVVIFDTGFPVDFAGLRRELGDGIRIQGGPHVDFLLRGTPREVYERCREILEGGVKTGPFMLREGNNLAPHTPLENTEAMFRAGRDFGRQREAE